MPEEFTEIHNAPKIVSLACLFRMCAEDPDSGFPFSQAPAKATREALSRFQMAGLTLRLSRWGATLSRRGWRESLNGACEAVRVGGECLALSTSCRETNLPQDIVVAGVRGATTSDVSRGERLCGESWRGGYTSKKATETSCVSRQVIGERMYCQSALRKPSIQETYFR